MFGKDRRDWLGRRHPPTDQKVGGSNPSERAKVLVTGLPIPCDFLAWPNLADKLARTWQIHGREVPTCLRPGRLENGRRACWSCCAPCNGTLVRFRPTDSFVLLGWRASESDFDRDRGRPPRAPVTGRLNRMGRLRPGR